MTRAILPILFLSMASCGDQSQPTTAAPAPSPSVAGGAAPPTATAGEPSPARIMPLGDSITQGDSDHETYRRPLWKTLESLGHRVDFVGSLRSHHRGAPPRSDFDMDHEGHWGWRTDEILERLEQWLTASEPDYVLVHLGSNDVFQGQPNDETIAELRRLIEITRDVRPQATIFLAQIIPTDRPAINRTIVALNREIARLAAPDVVIVDQHEGFDADAQTYDGVHPNPSGEIHLSERWLEALERALPAP